MKKKKLIEEFKNVKTTCDKIKKEIGKCIIGYDDVIEDLIICLITRSHMIMLGVPGIAKTSLAKSFSYITGLSWKRVQFTQDLLPSDIVGHYYFDQKKSEFSLRKGPIFSQILLADEINRAPPKTQSALIEAMQEKQVTIEGTTLKLPEPFLVIATKNPIETEGVYPLPEAQLDRFLYRVNMNYLKPEQEISILRMKNQNNNGKMKSIGNNILEFFIDLHHKVYVDETILIYILNILSETRNNDRLVLGASPRAGEHMLYAAKANAMINGRDYVIPDDVKKVLPKVLGHRIILSAEAEFEGITSEKILEDIMNNIDVSDLFSEEKSFDQK